MRLLNLLRATLLGSACSATIVSSRAIETEPKRDRLPGPVAMTPHPDRPPPTVSAPPAVSTHASVSAHAAISAYAGDGPADASRWRLVGLVVPADQVAVRAAVDGVLARCPGGVGDAVEAGDAIAFVDDGELALESERLKAKAAAVTHRAAAAVAEVRLLEQRGSQLRTGQEKRAANPSEVAQNLYLVEAAAARVKGLEEERKEAELERRALEQRRQNYRSVTPIRGEIAEVSRRRWEYVRAGETVARVRSLRRQVRVNLPGPLADRVPEARFTLAGTGPRRLLRPSAAAAAYVANGGRSVSLELPDGLVLAVGQEVDIEVDFDGEVVTP
jgi:hypothetical protein